VSDNNRRSAGRRFFLSSTAQFDGTPSQLANIFRNIRRIQFFPCHPARRPSLAFRRIQHATTHPCKVDQIDVLMSWCNIFQQDAVRLRKHTNVAEHATGCQQFYLKSGFFAHLANGSLVRQFVRVDVSAGWQPHIQFAMQQQQRASFVNNKRGRSKIARDG
jgi:hypothetical protein